MILKSALLGLGTCLWLWAAPMRSVDVATTQRETLEGGGTIRLVGSSGELNIESWERPEVEIELTRSKFCDDIPKRREQIKQELDRIHLAIKRTGSGELDVSTVLPSRRFLSPLRGQTNVTLNYRIRVPRDAKLIVHHEIGGVSIHDVTGAIEVSTRVGDIVLQLDGAGSYSIDAKSKFGDVYSEFPGAEHQHLIGQSFAGSAPAPSTRIYLRVGIGGIKVQKIGAPVY
jgi:hypothetical protein